MPLEKIRSFEIFINNRSIQNFKIRPLKRPDLAVAFPRIDNAENNGFEGIVEVGADEGSLELQVMGISEKNEHMLVGQKRIINSKNILSDPPQYFSLGLISQCNLSCKTCPKHSARSKLKPMKKVMDKEIVDKILLELRTFSPTLKRIGLQDYGEPFLYNNLFDVIEDIKCNLPNASIFLTSNGTVLNNHHIEKLLKSKITAITFSLDAANESTYQKIRIGGSLSLVIKNIKELISRREQLNLTSPLITTNFVITPTNVTEIPQYITLCEMLGVDYIGFVHPFGVFESDKQEIILPLGKTDNENSELFFKILDVVDKMRPKLKINLNIPNITPNECLVDCTFNGKNSIYINTEGDVYPCCVIAAKSQEQSSDLIPMGNVHNQSLQEIWDSHEFRVFRDNFYRGNCPHIVCKNCSKYYGI